MLQRAVTRIGKLTEGWEGGGTTPFAGLVDEFRLRMREGLKKGLTFEESTVGRRREWSLLKLYLNDLGDQNTVEQLFPFEENVASSIIGETASRLTRKDLRRLATQLYFTHFGLKRLPCLVWLAERLRQTWGSADPERLDADGLTWRFHADELFCKHAPEEVARNWQDGMTVSQLAQTYHIPEGGIFQERLLEAVILNRIREMPLNSSDPSLNEVVIAEKERTLRTGKPLGAAAVQILVKRSQNENSSMVPDNWKEHLVTFACDPRIPNSAMQARWWGWATSFEKDVAIRALSELSLQEFIKLLKQSLRDTGAEHQFLARSNMLLNLFKLGKVNDARLIVHSDLNHRLDARTKNVLRPSWVSGTTQHTSFICLRCTDDVFLIEGTHSFALRGFIGQNSFPVRGFWSSVPKEYHDSEFRVAETKCSIYQRHHTGDWIWDFLSQLRARNIEWRGLR
jgi:hypothetical protein